MDEIELLVIETYQHFNENFSSSEEQIEEAEIEEALPEGPGVLYHIQQSSSIFVIRTLVSQNIREDRQRIVERPEDFPSLRLLGGKNEVQNKLRFFVLEDLAQAEIIHDQLNNRRFPRDEEMVCNISDPGFSWWLSEKEQGFQLSFTLSVSMGEGAVKLGPLGDQQLALKNFQALENIITHAGLSLEMQNEANRVQFLGGEELLLEELKDLFQYGVLNEPLQRLFKLLAKRGVDHSELEMAWYYLQEIAAMRRFWIQVQYDLSAVES